MRVALVGDKFERSENLALGVLQGALEAHGHRVVQVPARGLGDLAETTRQVLRHRPGLVGVSIGYQVGAITALALVHHLRRSGYRGHITAGGAFATLQAPEILRDCPLDSVALFEGERPLVALAAHVEHGVPRLDEIAGLVVRTSSAAGAGTDAVHQTAPPCVWEDPFRYRAARSEQAPEHLGVRTVSMYASRGCDARCAYCCVAQLTDAARGQAVAAGKTAGAVARIRRRPPADVADEIAQLQRTRGAQLFRFEDDCLLGSSPRAALRTLSGLQEAIDARTIRAPAFTFKLRPDCVTPEVAAALARIGMIHGFVGIEAMTDETLGRIGRRGSAAQGRRALQLLADASISSYFNALIVGPDATPASIERDLDALDGVISAPLDIVTLILYAGTPLFERLRSQRRVRGNYLCWRYEFEDPRTEIVARTLARLPTRHTGAYTIGKRLADLQLNLAIARRFHPLASTRGVALELAHLTQVANESTIAVVRRVVTWARADPPASEQERFWRQLAADVGARDDTFASEIEALLAELETRASAGGPKRASAFLRSGLAAAVLGSVHVLSLGCECGSGPPTDSGGTVQDSGGADSGRVDSGAVDSGAVDSGASDAAPADSAIAEAGVGVDAGACTMPVTSDAAAWLEANAAAPCVPAICAQVDITFNTDASGTVVSLSGGITPAEEACILAALSGVCFPNATDSAVPVSVFGPCD